MKSWLLHRQEGLDAMELASDVEKPEPQKGEVLLKIHYAALNPADHYLARAMYPAKPEFPHILGRDGVGEVEEAGPNVSKFKKGDIAAILRGEIGVSKRGTFAEYVVVNEDLLIPVPDGWREEEAAAAPLVFLTAYQALTQWDFEQPGNVLITGATGGVGVAATMLAKAMGHRVVALSRSKEKGKELEKIGADLVLDPRDEKLAKKVKEFTGRDGIQVAVDNIGGEFFTQVVATLGYRGAVSCVGRLAGPVPEFNTAMLFFKRLRIGGTAVGDYSTEEAQKYWKVILDMLNKSGQRPIIDHVYAFEELKEAFARLEEGPMGKVLIKAPA